MDVTAIFRSCVETLRQRNKELALLNSDGNGNNDKQPSSKPKIFPGKKSEYFSKARELSTTITSLRDYVHENKNTYLNIAGTAAHASIFSPSGDSGFVMTDVDRDILDNDVHKIIQNCQSRIFEFEKVIEGTESIFNNPNLKTHLESITESLTAYLKEVTSMFSEMRAVRVKRTVDFQNMARLTTTSSSSSSKGHMPKSKAFSTTSNNGSLPFSSSSTKTTTSTTSSSTSSKALAPEEVKPVRKVPSVPDYFQDENEIPPEELQMLEEEN